MKRPSIPFFNSCLGALVALSLTASAAWSQTELNPGVAPAYSNPYGHSYGEWGALWWRWALSFPIDVNPVADETGVYAASGQSGPVWFLAGTFGNDVTREVTVPAGKGLFFPIFNFVTFAVCVEEPHTIEGLRARVAPLVDAVTDMAAEIDGVPVQNLSQYRAESPLFCTSLALLNIYTPEDLEGVCDEGQFDCLDIPNPEEHFGPGDGFGPAMTDGVWLMLAPLKAGQHTIHFSASSSDLALDVTYHLTVN